MLKTMLVNGLLALFLYVSVFYVSTVEAVFKFPQLSKHSLKPKFSTRSNVEKPAFIDVSPFEIVISNASAIDVKRILEKSFQGSDVHASSLGKFAILSGEVSITPKSLWITRKTYRFKVDVVHKIPKKRDTHVGYGKIELTCNNAPLGLFARRESLKLVAKLHQSANTLVVEYSIDGNQSKSNTKLLSCFKLYLDSILKNEIGVRNSRKHLLENYKIDSKAKAIETKRKRLDQIIHPEKYRSKRMRDNGEIGGESGRSSGGGGGNSRYRPSAATQARRQVKGR